jgi:hypothetical protein
MMVSSDNAVFNLVWTYAIKEVNNCKKAWCTCDGSPRLGQVWVLDFTHANCHDQKSTRIFNAVSAAENLLSFGADVSNAFAEAPPPAVFSPGAAIAKSSTWHLKIMWLLLIVPE